MIIKIVNVMYFFLFDNSDSKTTYGFKSFSINIPRKVAVIILPGGALNWIRL